MHSRTGAERGDVMRVYFDIMQKGELHLDDEGLEFDS
jgi:hypothetical protein